VSEYQLDVLRAEYVDVVIGEHLNRLLFAVVEATAPHYPAGEYTPAGVWNDYSLRDVAQQWIADRLVERGDLGAIVGSAKTEHALRSMLSRSLRQHLINQRTRSSATNLFDRMVSALREGFACTFDPGTLGEMRWALESGVEPAPGDVTRDLIVFASSRRDDDLGVVRYGPFSLKSSPILRGPQLRDFLELLLRKAGGSVSTSEMFTVLRHRFNLATLPPKDFHSLMEAEADGILAAGLGPAADADAHTQALAQAVTATLSASQLADLRLLSDSESLNAASAASGRSRHDLQTSLESVFALIAHFAESYEEAQSIQQLVVESLYKVNDDR